MLLWRVWHSETWLWESQLHTWHGVLPAQGTVRREWHSAHPSGSQLKIKTKNLPHIFLQRKLNELGQIPFISICHSWMSAVLTNPRLFSELLKNSQASPTLLFDTSSFHSLLTGSQNTNEWSKSSSSVLTWFVNNIHFLIGSILCLFVSPNKKTPRFFLILHKSDCLDKHIFSNHRVSASSGYLLSHFPWSRISEAKVPPENQWVLCLTECNHPAVLCQEAVGTSQRRAVAWDCFQCVVQTSPLCFGDC